MKTFVVLGLNLLGQKVKKDISITESKLIVSNPERFGFAKISAIMTEKAYKQTQIGT